MLNVKCFFLYQAETVLLWAIEHGGPPEKWAATQCLSLANTICDQVINELVRQLHSDNSVRAVEAGGLLAELSRHSVSIMIMMFIMWMM